MKHHIPLLLALLLLSACTTPEQQEQRRLGLTNMKGVPASTVFSIYGVPATTQTEADGAVTYTWTRTESHVTTEYEEELSERDGDDKRKPKTVAGKIGNSIFDSILGIDKPEAGDVVTEDCVLSITTRNGYVSEAKAKDEGDDLDPCDPYYSLWYKHQDSQSQASPMPAPAVMSVPAAAPAPAVIGPRSYPVE